MSNDPKNNSGRKPLKEKNTKNTKNKPLATNIHIAIHWNPIQAL